jgi:hypothetical protein
VALTLFTPIRSAALSLILLPVTGMDVSDVHAMIARGILPRSDWDWTRLVVGSAYGGCFVCGETTSPATMTVECYRAKVGFTLHPDCYVMWEEARKLDT